MKYKNSILWSGAVLLYILQSAAIVHFAVPNLRSQVSVLALYVGLGMGGCIAILHVVRVVMGEKRNLPANENKAKE